MKFKRLTALFLLIVICSLFFVSCNKGASGNTAGNKVGDICYTYTLEKIGGDGTDDIKYHRGSIVVIHFFGVWSGDIADVDKIATNYDGEVKVFAIHSTHESSKAPAFIEENYKNSKITFLYDKRNGNAEDKYYTALGGTDTYPRTLILDKNGVITFVKDGAPTYEELVEAIKNSK